MQIEYAGINVILTEREYFFVTGTENDKLQITITGRNRHPIKISGVSRKHLYALQTQIQKVLLLQDASKVDDIVEPADVQLESEKIACKVSAIKN